MELREPIKKRTGNNRNSPKHTFPVIIDNKYSRPIDDSIWIVYNGQYYGQYVSIGDPEEMESLYSMGFYGKGSLSRSYPSFGKAKQGIPPLIRERQWANRLKWANKLKEGVPSKLEEETGVELSPTSEIIRDQPEGVVVENEEAVEENNSEQGQKNSVLVDDKEKENISEEMTGANKKVEEEKEGSAVEENSINRTPGEKVVEDNEKKINEEEGESIKKGNCNDEEGESIKKGNCNEEEGESIKKGNCNEDNEENSLKNESEEEKSEVSSKRKLEEEKEEGAAKKPCTEKERDIDGELKNGNIRTPSVQLSRRFSMENRGGSELVVVADSDEEAEDFLEKLNPRLVREETVTVMEELRLTLEEAFFLSFGLGCLSLTNIDGEELSIRTMWKLFREVQNDFVQMYIVYHYFRSKGWVVKPGLKFGGDFILYKKGPPFYHASYIVLVEVVDQNFKRLPDKNKRKLTWEYIGGLNRLAETTNKEVLCCQVQWPNVTNEEMDKPSVLTQFKVNEVLLRRWQATQERDA